jgi:ATP-binding cassette, subfamily B, bacterial
VKTNKNSRFSVLVCDHLRQVKGRLFIAGICVIGYLLTQLLVPWPIKLIIDHVLLHKELPALMLPLAQLISADRPVAIIVISSSIALLAFCRGFFTYVQLYITSRIGFQLVHMLRRELFAHLQRLSLSFHNQTGPGELLAKVTGDTNTLGSVFSDSPLAFVAELLLVIGMIAVMVIINWRLSIIPLVTIPLLFGSLSYRFKKINNTASRQRSNEGKIATRLNEVLTAVPLVQALSQQQYEEQRFENESALSLEQSIRAARLEAAATRTVEVISALGLGAVVLAGSFQVLNGAMLPGELLVFVGYISNMNRPVRALARLSIRFSKARVSAERIADILNVEPEIIDAPDAIAASRLKGHVVFENVSFDYGDGKSILKDASFSLSPGKRGALIGKSGSGKSTVVSLILRFYDPKSGTISIDGVDVRDYQLESLRRNIGIVMQDSMLFGGTIRENIAYGKPDTSLEEIVTAARAANAHEFIEKLEHGYDTVISGQGRSLSGGQRQRIAIARTIILDTPILILDEPMRGLDAESRMKVEEALDRLMVGRTCLLVTHDLEAAARADITLTLMRGRVFQRDTTSNGTDKSLICQPMPSDMYRARDATR